MDHVEIIVGCMCQALLGTTTDCGFKRNSKYILIAMNARNLC